MRSSWVCWWLLLTWALLLGQPVSGEEEGYQEPPLEESDELVEARQPEAAVEQGEVEEPEDPLEPEDIAEPEDSVEREDVGEPELSSEEELEQHARLLRDYMQENDEWEIPLRGRFKQMALYYLQSRDDDYSEYRHLEDSSITIQKAIGSIVKFRMFVVKGNCPEGRRMYYDDYLDYYLSYRHRLPWESISPCEKLDCTFTMFMDARNQNDAILKSRCMPLVLANDLMHQRYLEDEGFDSLDYEDPDSAAPHDEDDADSAAPHDEDDADSAAPHDEDDADSAAPDSPTY